MILSLTAAAGHRFGAVVVADTSIIPTAKTSITNKPLAEKVEGSTVKKSGSEKKSTSGANRANIAAKKSTAAKTTAAVNTNSANKATATGNTKSSANGNTNIKTNTPAKSSTAAKTTAAANTNSANKTTATANTKSSANGNTNIKTNTSAKNSTAAKTTAAAKTNSANKTTTVKSATTAKTNTTPKSNTTATKKTPLTGKTLAAITPTETNKTRSSKTKSRKLRKGIGIELYPPLAFKYAILLDVPVEKVTDEKLLQVLDHWYGTRYRYGGETRRGIDCSAFTQAFMRSYFDYELPRTSEEQYATCKHIKKRKLRQGDLVFFKTSGPKGGISHVGVYLVNNRFVHSATSTGVRISDLNDDYYKEKYAGAGRIR